MIRRHSVKAFFEKYGLTIVLAATICCNIATIVLAGSTSALNTETVRLNMETAKNYEETRRLNAGTVRNYAEAACKWRGVSAYKNGADGHKVADDCIAKIGVSDER